MLTLMCACLLVGSSFAAHIQRRSSFFEGEHGDGGGTAFSYSKEQENGPITALRVSESDTCIVGLQFRYGKVWGPNYGGSRGPLHEVELRPGEDIIQVSGKKNSYVAELIFLTNYGRLLRFGQPSGTSFNDFPPHPDYTLRYVSGRYGGLLFTYTHLYSIGFHWGTKAPVPQVPGSITPS
ncbi:zymogen granule membrane protein 16-like [Discoglossus pictus]